jgi:hypothetical protein
MKKFILVTIIALAIAGVVFAGNHHGSGHKSTGYNCYKNGGHYHYGVYYGGHH